MGSSGFSGTVQPQLACAAEMTSGLVPVFLNRKLYATLVPSAAFPKSYTESITCTEVVSVKAAFVWERFTKSLLRLMLHEKINPATRNKKVHRMILFFSKLQRYYKVLFL